MIRPDMDKWGQTIDDLRRRALESPHPRTRERFLALYMIATEQTNATRWAEQTGLNDETVLRWVHRYNESGPETLTYKRTGGCAPFFHRNRSRRSSPPSRPPTRRTMTCPAADGR
jgi:Homeodomain-like domain